MACNCYAQYTSKEKIILLQQKIVASEEPQHATAAPNSPRKTSSHVEQVNWNNASFVKNENLKERLASVMTFKMSE